MSNYNENEKNSYHALLIKSSLVGTVTGFSDVVFSHPFWVLKTRYQSGFSLSFKPKVLYTGFLPNFFNNTSMATVEIVTSIFVETNLNKLKGLEKETKMLLAGFSGGLSTSLITTPFETVITMQHKYGKNFYQAAHNLIKQRGLLSIYCGFFGTAIREGLFVSGYYALNPLIKSNLAKISDNTLSNIFIASFITSLITSLLSHPFDTIKTQQQALVDEANIGVINTMIGIYKRNGIYGFYKGFTPRLAKVFISIFIMSNIFNYLKENVLDNELEKMDIKNSPNSCNSRGL